MICANCQHDASHIKVTRDGERCENCGGFSATSGARVDNAAGRNSFRIRSEQAKHEGDMMPPHIYNPATRRAEPNPEFIKRFPDTAHYHYSPQELEKAGMKKMAAKVKEGLKVVSTKGPEQNVKFSGSKKKAMAKVLGKK